MYRIASFLKLGTLVILCTVFAAVIARTELSAAQLTLSWSDNSNNEDGFRVEEEPALREPMCRSSACPQTRDRT